MDKAAFREMLATEYAFADSAKASVRDAFLAYLAEDSLVLEPGPIPGRAYFEALKPNSDRLEWYPAVAAMAASADLGFTSGPWVYTGAANAHAYGHFLTVWKRDAECHWHAQFDGGIAHAQMADPPPKLLAEEAEWQATAAPSAKLVAADALSKTVRDFEHTAQQDGLSAGVRTYARDADFRFYADDRPPLSAGAADRLLAGRAPLGSWSEDGRVRSADSTLAYSVGRVSDSKKGGTNAYVQIWQYDPKVANWGLRLLLLTAL